MALPPLPRHRPGGLGVRSGGGVWEHSEGVNMRRPHGYTWLNFSIPERMGDAILRYVREHIQPGDFLSAVICNDLKEACGRADDENLQNLPAYVAWFYNCAPIQCWGSYEQMKEWLAARRTKDGSE